jgi:hypothetical protein
LSAPETLKAEELVRGVKILVLQCKRKVERIDAENVAEVAADWQGSTGWPPVGMISTFSIPALPNLFVTHWAARPTSSEFSDVLETLGIRRYSISSSRKRSWLSRKYPCQSVIGSPLPPASYTECNAEEPEPLA